MNCSPVKNRIVIISQVVMPGEGEDSKDGQSRGMIDFSSSSKEEIY